MNIAGVYRHFKGNNYEVIGEAIDDAHNSYILYRQLYDPFAFWIRPAELFWGKKEVNHVMTERFTRICDSQKDILTSVDLFKEPVIHSESEETYHITDKKDGIFHLKHC